MADFANSIIVFSVFAFVAFLIWNGGRIRLEGRRLQHEAQAQLLEKIGSGQALTEFLQTDEGKRYLDQLTRPPSAPARNQGSQTRILVLTTLGLIALFAGFFFMMAFSIPTVVTADSGSLGAARFVAYVPALLLTGGGIGALIAAVIMHRLSKKWGMLEANGPEETVG